MSFQPQILSNLSFAARGRALSGFLWAQAIHAINIKFSPNPAFIPPSQPPIIESRPILIQSSIQLLFHDGWVLAVPITVLPIIISTRVTALRPALRESGRKAVVDIRLTKKSVTAFALSAARSPSPFSCNGLVRPLHACCIDTSTTTEAKFVHQSPTLTSTSPSSDMRELELVSKGSEVPTLK